MNNFPIDIDLTSIKPFLDEITLSSSKINENQDKILKILESLDSRITNLEKNINKDSKVNLEDFSYLKELKNETLELSKEIVIKALSFRDYRSIIHIFREFYKVKNDKKYSYPIRIISKRSYDFYDNGKWNNDLYGYISMNTLINNIQNLFIKHNNLDNDSVTQDDFLLNQDFIYKLSTEKYKKDVFRNIIEEVRINTH
jgi:hypothetical protein